MSAERGLSIQQLCGETGLEESLVRFYESRYGRLFPPRRLDGMELRFAPETVDILLRLHELVESGETDIEAVELQLSEASEEPAPGACGAASLAVTSGKGGVGKSNLSLAISMELARRGFSVLLLDADLGSANQHILAGVRPAVTLDDVVLHGRGIEKLVTPGPQGVGIVAGASGIYQLANLNPLQRRTLQNVLARLRARADVLVIDTGTGLSDNVVGFAAGADEALVVSTPDLTSITDAYGMLKTLDRMNATARLSVICNRVQSGHEGQRVFNRLSACTARFLSRPIHYAGHVFRDSSIERATAARVPFLQYSPEGRAARSLRRVADGIALRLLRRGRGAPGCMRQAG